MTAIFAFFLSPVGRIIGIVLIALSVVSGSYAKGYFDGRAAYKAKIERQIRDAVQSGTEARGRALDELNSGRVPDGWFRD